MDAAGYLNVEFVEDVSEFQCVRCNHVLFQHYISNCGHAFCPNCKRILDDGSQRWKCPSCQEFIKNIDIQNEELDKKLKEMAAHCPNKKYGCSFVHQLKFIQDHLKECDFTREKCLPKLIEDNENKNLNSEQMFEINERFNKLNAEMNEMREKIIINFEKPEKADQSAAVELKLIKMINEIKGDMKEEMNKINLEINKIKINVNLAIEECKSKISEFKGQSDAVYRLIDYKEEKLLTAINKSEREVNANLLSKIHSQIDVEINKKSENLSTKMDFLRVKIEQQILKIDKLNEFQENENQNFKHNINEMQSTIEDLKVKRFNDGGLKQHPGARKTQFNENSLEVENWSTLHEIKFKGQILEYVGRGRDPVVVGSAQAGQPLSPSHHYFEIEIIDSGVEIYPIVTMGLTRRGYPKDYHPGWTLGSIGYHGDDGNLFDDGKYGKSFGPKCGLGDRMGCGINFLGDDADNWSSNNEQRSTGTKKQVKIYFTKNGRPVGTIYVKDLPPGGFYPTVGMRTVGAKVRVGLQP